MAGTVRQKRGHRYADESVKGVPKQVEIGNLVREHLDQEQSNGDDDNFPVLDEVKAGRKLECAKPTEQTQGGNGRIDIKSCRETGGYDEGDSVIGRDLHLRNLGPILTKSKRLPAGSLFL